MKKKVMIHVVNTNGEVWMPVVSSAKEAILDLIEQSDYEQPQLGTICQCFNSKEVPFDVLPDSIRPSLTNTMNQYGHCTVYYEYGEFHTSVSAPKKEGYGVDYFLCGTY